MLETETITMEELEEIKEESMEEQIRILAYQKWLDAGSPISDGTEFWLKAEAELQ